jgi:hypothetical protein
MIVLFTSWFHTVIVQYHYHILLPGSRLLLTDSLQGTFDNTSLPI